ncbi:MAG TPA: TetR family transcriptional regulator [Usitatibacter sp.]
MARKSNTKRARGRPAAGVDLGTREALLDAAVALFAEQGVGATRLAEVAGRAGVTAAMVHYHFRTRDRLLDAVAKERLARFMHQVFEGLELEDSTIATLIQAIVRRIYAAADQMPWVPPIWIREVVAEGGAMRERMLALFPVQTFAVLTEMLAREQRARRIPPGIEPRLVFMTIAGVAMLPLAARPLWSRLPGMADLTNAQLLRHALSVIAKGLAPSKRIRGRR